MENNIFELAAQKKVRFDSSKGSITVEQLYDLPLTSNTGFDLNTIAKTVNATLKQDSEESFVSDVKLKPAQVINALKLEVVKHVIATKQKENADRLARADKAQKRAKLIDLLGKKQDATLESLSEADIKKQLEALDD